MRIRTLLVALAVLLVCAWPDLSHAQSLKVYKRIWTGAATDTTAVGMADSSGVIFTGNCDRLYLYLRPSVACRLAIQVRTHIGTATDTAGVSLTDSLNTASWLWRQHVGAAGTVFTATDSSTAINLTRSTSVVAGEDEYVVHFIDNADDATAVKWEGPRGRYIALAKVDSGEPYWGRQTSIRVRVLAAPATPVRLTGTLLGMGN